MRWPRDWRHNDLPTQRITRYKREAPRREPRGNRICNQRPGAAAMRATNAPFSHSLGPQRKRCAFMSSNHPHTSRGEAIRRALLAIVEVRAVADLPLPPHRAMAAALGISPGQVTRHLGVLMDAGAFSTRIAGMHTRITEVRP